MFEPTGEYGLRHRVRVGWKLLNSYLLTAQALGVPEQVIIDYLSDQNYVPSPDDVATIISNLDALPGGETGDTHTKKHNIVYVEYPLWTRQDMLNLVAPPNADFFIIQYHAGYADDDIRSAGPVDYPFYQPVTVADVAVGSEYERITAVVWYCKVV